jgi:hypothetical protein
MREGSALDAELADAIGVAVEELPEGKVWERERAYFLRDLFLEKVFREKGLVTRATNTRTMLRTQKVALYSFGFVGLAAFATLAWFALGHLKSSIKDQGDYWHVVSTNGWENAYWRKSIVPFLGDGSFKYSVSSDPVQIENKSVSLGEFHAKLRDLAQNPLGKNIFFPGLSDRYNQNRFRAQRIVFEAGIVRPLIDAARQKMMHPDTDPGSLQRQPDALAALIQLESDIRTRGNSPASRGDLSMEGARKFLATFESYIAGADVTPDTNLVAVMSWTYSTNEIAKGSWVPVRFSGRRGETNTLAVNTAIGAGLQTFVSNATNDVKTQKDNWLQIDAFSSNIRAFAKAEEALFNAADGPDDKFVAAQQAVDTARANLDNAIKAASSNPLFAKSMSLASAQQTFRSTVLNSAGAAFGRVRDVNDAAMAANPGYPLFAEINKYLEEVKTSVSNQNSELIARGNATDFQALDDNYLAANAFATRAALYLRAENLAAEKPFANATLLGLGGEQLDRFLKTKVAAVKDDAAKYSGKLNDKFARVIDHHLKRAERLHTQAFFAAYLAEARKQLTKYGGFPLVRDLSRPASADNFRDAGKNLKFISDDFSSAFFKSNNPADYLADWKKFRANVETEQLIAIALSGENGLNACKVYLDPIADINSAEEGWRASGIYRNVKLASGGDPIQTGSAKEEELGQVPVNQKVELVLIKNANEPNSRTVPLATEDWGPLWLLHKYPAKRDATDKTVWHVQMPISAADAKGIIRLKLKFENPLPDLDNWPMAAL